MNCIVIGLKMSTEDCISLFTFRPPVNMIRPSESTDVVTNWSRRAVSPLSRSVDVPDKSPDWRKYVLYPREVPTGVNTSADVGETLPPTRRILPSDRGVIAPLVRGYNVEAD